MGNLVPFHPRFASTPTYSRSKSSPCSLLDDVSVETEYINQLVSPQSISSISNCSMLDDDRTTLMIRNIPNKYKRMSLVREIGEGADFVYLPMSRKKAHMNLGYAFVNFKSADLAQKFLQDFQDHEWKRFGKKNAAVYYAEIQGFEANVQYFEEKCPVDVGRKAWVEGN